MVVGSICRRTSTWKWPKTKVGKQAARINPHPHGADGTLQPVYYHQQYLANRAQVQRQWTPGACDYSGDGGRGPLSLRLAVLTAWRVTATLEWTPIPAPTTLLRPISRSIPGTHPRQRPRMSRLAYPIFLSAMLTVPLVQGANAAPSAVLDRADDTGFIRVEAQSFASLGARQQQLPYWLAQAAIATDPIAYDQFSRFGLRQKRLLEGIA